jgi:hypothetical protein
VNTFGEKNSIVPFLLASLEFYNQIPCILEGKNVFSSLKTVPEAHEMLKLNILSGSNISCEGMPGRHRKTFDRFKCNKM